MAVLPSLSEGSTIDSIKMGNHLENHFHISNKRAMYMNIKEYLEKMGRNVNEIFPLTFLVSNYDDPVLKQFEEAYN